MLSRWKSWVVLLTVVLGCRLTAAEEPVAAESQLKAVCLFYFAKFTDWPTNAFATAQSPVRIAVVGQHPVSDDLEAMVKDKLVKGRPVEIIRPRQFDGLAGCHVVFVSPSEQDRFGALRLALEGRPVLTVGETSDFLRRGGAIRFVIVENRVRFVINKAVLDRAGLTISSEVLRLADRVERGKP